MRVSWIAALCLCTASAGLAERYAIDDMLSVESYGKAIMSPDGEWAIIERYRRYDQAAAYHFDAFNKRMLGEIMMVDLVKGGAPRPLFAQTASAGYWAGSLSPDGRHLTVFRLQRDNIALGIVSIADGSVRWLDATPVTALLNPLPLWRDDDHLLVLTSDTSKLPYPLDSGSRLQRELPVRWERTASGMHAGISVTTSRQITDADKFVRHVLVEIDIKSLVSRRVTDGAIADMNLSHDGKWLAMLEEGNDARPEVKSPVSPNARPRRHRIRIVSVQDGQSTSPCGDCDIQPGLLAWREKRSSLLYFARRVDEPWSNGRLMAFDTQTGANSVMSDMTQEPWLPENDSGAQLVRAGWHGNSPQMLSKEQRGTSRWRAQDGKPSILEGAPCQAFQFATDGDDLLAPCPDGLWRMSPNRAPVKVFEGEVRLDQPFEETFDVGITERYRPFVAARSRSFHIKDAAGALSAASLGKDRGLSASLPPGTKRLLGFSAISGRGLAISRTAKGMSQLWLVRDGGEAEPLDSINAHLEQRATPTAIAVPSRHAGLINWLLLPQGRPIDAKLPLVIMPYPGAVFAKGTPPPLAPDMVSGAVNPLLMLSLGYAVLLPSLRHDRTLNEPAQNLVEQIEAAADQAIGTNRIDGGRMAIYGHSFGGYCALLVASRSNRFRAIIASASIPDLTLQHGPWLPYDSIDLEQGFPVGPAYGWAELGQASLQSPPWRDIQRYARNSPYYALDRIRSPVLLIHGDLDPVPIFGAERMFSGLYRAGADVSMVRFWGEGHAVRSPANIRAMWDQIKEWLSQTLTTQPAR
ncbi:alpha/beta fold hydrolase [Blastomonas sp. AAP53]|uniref:alpha/beta hydrolase family protein n=1 Tax=Blastomonas sp. AAP53 TaxID=1248760 RepID=UPI0002E64A45|nr:alpha/beta fold hydrolase [Blastomonas sp. AAP53]